MVGARCGLLLTLISFFAAYPAARPAEPASERSAVSRWKHGMTLREKVGQLVIAPCYGEDPSSRSKIFVSSFILCAICTSEVSL